MRYQPRRPVGRPRPQHPFPAASRRVFTMPCLVLMPRDANSRANGKSQPRGGTVEDEGTLNPASGTRETPNPARGFRTKSPLGRPVTTSINATSCQGCQLWRPVPRRYGSSSQHYTTYGQRPVSPIQDEPGGSKWFSNPVFRHPPKDHQNRQFQAFLVIPTSRRSSIHPGCRLSSSPGLSG